MHPNFHWLCAFHVLKNCKLFFLYLTHGLILIEKRNLKANNCFFHSVLPLTQQNRSSQLFPNPALPCQKQFAPVLGTSSTH